MAGLKETLQKNRTMIMNRLQNSQAAIEKSVQTVKDKEKKQEELKGKKG